MPQLEITPAEMAVHIANMGRAPQIRAAMWAYRPPQRREDAVPTPCPAPAPVAPPCQRKGVNLYPFPIGPWPHNPDAEFDANRPVVKPRDIMRETADRHGLTMEQMLSPSRKKRIVKARQEAMWAVKTRARRSFPETARLFGGFDHTTVISACRKVQKLVDAGRLNPFPEAAE